MPENNKAMLLLLILLTGLVLLYFYIFGFSGSGYVRIGQYAGLVVCAFFIIDTYFRGF